MKAFHAKRLLKLADFLMTIPNKRFNFGVWAGAGWDGKGDHLTESCRTTGCALGWAPSIPSFRRAGLKLYKQQNPSTSYNQSLVIFGKPKGEFLDPMETSLNSAMKFFGLSYSEAELLFIPDDSVLLQCGSERGFMGMKQLLPDATPKQVARHIRQFVKLKMKEKERAAISR